MIYKFPTAAPVVKPAITAVPLDVLDKKFRVNDLAGSVLVVNVNVPAFIGVPEAVNTTSLLPVEEKVPAAVNVMPLLEVRILYVPVVPTAAVKVCVTSPSLTNLSFIIVPVGVVEAPQLEITDEPFEEVVFTRAVNTQPGFVANL